MLRPADLPTSTCVPNWTHRIGAVALLSQMSLNPTLTRNLEVGVLWL